MDNGGDDWGTYIIPKEENLKSYYIKSENYTDDSFKKSGKVIAPMEGTSGNDRFYVMALNDLDSNSHYWSYNLVSSDSIIVSTTTNDFGNGKKNTETMVEVWNNSGYENQNANDIWGLIQDEVTEGWFVPSKSEWSAFGATFGITSSNYSSTFGLADIYWSSSLFNRLSAYYVTFKGMTIGYNAITGTRLVRLATTF